MPGSVSFDRAAEYYDRTRGLSEEGTHRTVELLAGELSDRGPVLEIGVGTGQLALPLRTAGVGVVGLDLSRSMLDRLVAKGGSGVPLVRADATRLPFPDEAFGGAYFRWVLHLIPAWEHALAELVRVVRGGGVILECLAAVGTGRQAEIKERFLEIVDRPQTPAGLDWGEADRLIAAMEQLGTVPRRLAPFHEIERDGVEDFLDGIREDRYSWTWTVPAADRREAAQEVRAWAVERFGPLDQVPHDEHEITWRAYDLPAP